MIRLSPSVDLDAHHAQQCLSVYDVLGALGTNFRELAWKKPIFSGSMVPKPPKASQHLVLGALLDELELERGQRLVLLAERWFHEDHISTTPL
jgi:hypothetical protein